MLSPPPLLPDVACCRRRLLGGDPDDHINLYDELGFVGVDCKNVVVDVDDDVDDDDDDDDDVDDDDDCGDDDDDENKSPDDDIVDKGPGIVIDIGHESVMFATSLMLRRCRLELMRHVRSPIIALADKGDV